MKKKNIKLGKLQFTKTQIASLKSSQQRIGGIYANDTAATLCTCPDPEPQPPTEGICPTGPTGCLCPSQGFPCAPTEGTECATNHSCGGGFLCDNQTIGIGF